MWKNAGLADSSSDTDSIIYREKSYTENMTLQDVMENENLLDEFCQSEIDIGDCFDHIFYEKIIALRCFS